jgi:hypothetical protein
MKQPRPGYRQFDEFMAPDGHSICSRLAYSHLPTLLAVVPVRCSVHLQMFRRLLADNSACACFSSTDDRQWYETRLLSVSPAPQKVSGSGRARYKGMPYPGDRLSADQLISGNPPPGNHREAATGTDRQVVYRSRTTLTNRR